MDAKERYRMLLRVRGGQDPEYYDSMPQGGYGTYDMFDLEEDESPKPKGKQDGKTQKSGQAKKPTAPKPKPENGQSGSSTKFLDIIQGQNERYAQVFSSMLEKLPTQKEFHSLSSEIEKIRANQEILAKEIENLQPPSPDEKSQQIRDANPDMIPVGDYFRQHYADSEGKQKSSFNGTLDSIAGKSFRDYLNL